MADSGSALVVRAEPKYSEERFTAPAGSCSGKMSLSAHLVDFELELGAALASLVIAAACCQSLEAVDLAYSVAGVDWHLIVVVVQRKCLRHHH